MKSNTKQCSLTVSEKNVGTEDLLLHQGSETAPSIKNVSAAILNLKLHKSNKLASLCMDGSDFLALPESTFSKMVLLCY